MKVRAMGEKYMNKNIQDSTPLKQGNKARKPSTKGSASREHIIATAIKLFQERGYAKTSLSEIARQVGLNQSSLYYWFPSKEAILECIFQKGDMESFVDKLQKAQATPTEKIYSLIVCDVVKKCELPFDFFELESLAHNNPERFDFLFKNYRICYQAMIEIIKAGVEEQEFFTRDADETAVVILSIVEGLQHHFHAKQRGELILEASGYCVKNHTPENIGHIAAHAILFSLSAKEIDLDNIRKNCQDILHEII